MIQTASLTGSKKSSGTTGTSGYDVYRGQFIASHPRVEPPAPVNKYHTIQSLKESQKIDALKDTKLNPDLIENGFDGVAHGLHLWTVVGSKTQANKTYTPQQKEQIASNFYDRVIGPAYGKLYADRGKDSHFQYITKEQWTKMAYTEALNYKIEEAYSNSMSHGSQGWDNGLAAEARAFGKIASMVHGTLDDAIDWWQKNKASLDPVGPSADGKYQHTAEEQKAGLEKDLAESKQHWDEMFHHPFDGVSHPGQKPVVHYDDALQKAFREEDANDQFWAAALPTRDGFLHKATSFVAEQAAQTPLYLSMALVGPEASGSSLTAKLMLSPVGKWTARTLLAGAEGYAYGTAVKKQDDPNEGFRDAIGFAVFHQLFEVGGWGVKKLIDVAPDSWKEALTRKSEKYDLAQTGQRFAKPAEVYDGHVTKTANELAASGQMGVRAIHVAALQHIEEMESVSMSPKAIKQYQAAMLDPETGDPARWASVFAASKYIKKILGKQKLADATPGSALEKKIGKNLAQLVVDAGTTMNTRVEGMAEGTARKAARTIKTPAAKNALAYYEAQVRDELAKSHAGALATPEQITEQAQKRFIRDSQAAVEEAEKQHNSNPVAKAQKIANRRRPPVDVDIVTRHPKVKSGKLVEVKVVPYMVRLAQHKKAAASKGQSLSEYFKLLPDEDFADDLTTHFYPAALKKAKIFFEGQNTREGLQNPNYLAFMRNYASMMPKEFQEVLEERTIESVKGQKHFNFRNQMEPQLDYYAKAMYNHVDNFLGSGRWPEEHNLFRSSNETIFQTTKWQQQLLVEKGLQEQNNLKEMFADDPKNLSIALKTHAGLMRLRMAEFRQASQKRGSQDVIRGFDSDIADLQTSTGYFKRWNF